MSSGDDSSEDGDFRSDVLTAVGMSPGRSPSLNSSQVKMKQASERSWLLAGEKVQIEESNIGYMSAIGKIGGRVFVTNYRLRFEAKDSSVRESKCCQFDVPLGCISRVEKVGYSTVSRGEDSYGLEITCKDMRNIRFTHQQTNHSRRPLYESLQKFAFPVTSKLPFFATVYKPEWAFDGWSLYDPMKEFQRMNIPNETWRITKINDRYEFADTYPALLAVPSAALIEGDDFLHKVGEFRSKQRIPVLSWLNPVTQAAITRSSQPMVGVTSRKSAEDEKLVSFLYLQMIIEANAHAHQLLIFDARPVVNAKVNKAKGGGFEDSYANCRLIFLDIQNIHVVRESLRKLKDASFPRVDEKNWLRVLDETKWLSHIQTILDGATQIAREIEDNHASVLVHCSDGWDRTAQLTSVAMVQLDPYYRTINGFAVLIEKEWCSFGHKFAHRIGHGEDKHGDSERSPIFVQFIDCVWQIMDQFPYAFEFNAMLLIVILDELYACRFGTFLYNSEKQRHRDQRVRESTVSLWSYIDANRRRFLNPLYNRFPRFIDVLRPNTKMARIRPWKDYYFRYNPRIVAQDRIDVEPLVNEKILQRLEALNELVEAREQLVNKVAQASPLRA
ncbi:Myotubularin-related protein 2 [Toxocara canis]|uniref:phosphatidylinositol-3,5-bisphosphate 3-phosphatase n=1 Tax=Toxocara canis TaxID=6265 RepID=A0A0B2W3C3_TOXCA|nr:Myotubularin-related protein 2 [Toxocara canis]